MTYEELTAMLKEVNLPFAYDHFAEGESPDPPFFVFLIPSEETFGADNIVYASFAMKCTGRNQRPGLHRSACMRCSMN